LSRYRLTYKYKPVYLYYADLDAHPAL